MNNSDHSLKRRELDELLRRENTVSENDSLTKILDYARFMAEIENVLVVVSDMADRKSHIVSGGFALNLEIGEYLHENSIWESRIISLMSHDEQEAKYVSELRFFHYLRNIPKNKRKNYHLVSRLRIRFSDGNIHDVLHRMYYVFDENYENVRFAICIYGPMSFDLKGKSLVVDSITGITEELTESDNSAILSARECQVLSLIDTGMKSAEIAEALNISIHTVSRHRQEIIGKLQVKNSHEACRVAKMLKII